MYLKKKKRNDVLFQWPSEQLFLEGSAVEGNRQPSEGRLSVKEPVRTQRSEVGGVCQGPKLASTDCEPLALFHPDCITVRKLSPLRTRCKVSHQF